MNPGSVEASAEIGRPPGGGSALPAAAQLPDQVAAALRERILSGELRPGQRLRPEQISADLGVSATPVREALQALRADDMVKAQPRRGFVVAPLEREDVVDLFTVEAELTGELAVRAAARAGAADLGHLRRLARRVDDEIEAAARRTGTADEAAVVGATASDGLVEAERAFHVAVNRLARSRKLAWLADRTANYVPRTFYTRSDAWRAAASRSHEALLRALETGDGPGARTAMSGHVSDGRDLLLAHLDAVGLWQHPAETDSA
jgi:DNA-binding GntR family transcriptional regulator